MRIRGANPAAYGGPGIFRSGWAKGASKPYTITEWNFCGPGRFRGVGGLLTGAFAAEQEWDGLWRFAYSHSVRGMDCDSASAVPGSRHNLDIQESSPPDPCSRILRFHRCVLSCVCVFGGSNAHHCRSSAARSVTKHGES